MSMFTYNCSPQNNWMGASPDGLVVDPELATKKEVCPSFFLDKHVIEEEPLILFPSSRSASHHAPFLV